MGRTNLAVKYCLQGEALEILIAQWDMSFERNLAMRGIGRYYTIIVMLFIVLGFSQRSRAVDFAPATAYPVGTYPFSNHRRRFQR